MKIIIINIKRKFKKGKKFFNDEGKTARKEMSRIKRNIKQRRKDNYLKVLKKKKKKKR
jgi:hypothetical protein